jgi:hypothetical protein
MTLLGKPLLTGEYMKRLASVLVASAAIFMATQSAPVAASTVANLGGIPIDSALVAAAGDRLPGGTVIYSPNRAYFISFQPDGNLVVYRVGAPNVVLWASGTNAPGSTAVFQGDGNLVIYRDLNDVNSVVWNSTTQGPSNGVIVPQVRLWDDGRLTIEGPSGRYYEGYPDSKVYTGQQVAIWFPYCASPGNRQWSVSWQNWSAPGFFGISQLSNGAGSCSLN